jgi:hypothetical protein
MKKMIVLTGLLLGFSSCEKMEFFHKDKECPTVSRGALPAGLAEKFSVAYPSATSTVWFDKDGKNYVAIFLNNGVETDAIYDHSGNFLTQEVETADDNDEENNDDQGCECDLETEDGE